MEFHSCASSATTTPTALDKLDTIELPVVRGGSGTQCRIKFGRGLRRDFTPPKNQKPNGSAEAAKPPKRRPEGTWPSPGGGGGASIRRNRDVRRVQYGTPKKVARPQEPGSKQPWVPSRSSRWPARGAPENATRTKSPPGLSSASPKEVSRWHWPSTLGADAAEGDEPANCVRPSPIAIPEETLGLSGEQWRSDNVILPFWWRLWLDLDSPAGSVQEWQLMTPTMQPKFEDEVSHVAVGPQKGGSTWVADLGFDEADFSGYSDPKIEISSSSSASTNADLEDCWTALLEDPSPRFPEDTGFVRALQQARGNGLAILALVRQADHDRDHLSERLSDIYSTAVDAYGLGFEPPPYELIDLCVKHMRELCRSVDPTPPVALHEKLRKCSIGRSEARLFEARSAQHVRLGNFKSAAAVLVEGIRAGAKPTSILERSLKRIPEKYVPGNWRTHAASSSEEDWHCSLHDRPVGHPFESPCRETVHSAVAILMESLMGRAPLAEDQNQKKWGALADEVWNCVVQDSEVKTDAGLGTTPTHSVPVKERCVGSGRSRLALLMKEENIERACHAHLEGVTERLPLAEQHRLCRRPALNMALVLGIGTVVAYFRQDAQGLALKSVLERGSYLLKQALKPEALALLHPFFERFRTRGF